MNTNDLKTPLWLVVCRILFTLGLLGVIWFIFSNSLQVAEQSQAASGRVLSLLQSGLTRLGMPGLAQRLTQHLIRKLAHFCEYALEGFLLMLCLRVYTKHFVRHISWPILGGLLTALCDETLQMFTSGRSSQLTDVWLDFSGVMAGLFAGLLLLCLGRMCVILYLHRKE